MNIKLNYMNEKGNWDIECVGEMKYGNGEH